MKWSTEMPTEPGFYWVRELHSTYIAYVGDLIIYPLDPKDTDGPYTAPYALRQWAGAEWCKIPEPSDG